MLKNLFTKMFFSVAKMNEDHVKQMFYAVQSHKINMENHNGFAKINSNIIHYGNIMLTCNKYITKIDGIHIHLLQDKKCHLLYNRGMGTNGKIIATPEFHKELFEISVKVDELISQQEASLRKEQRKMIKRLKENNKKLSKTCGF